MPRLRTPISDQAGQGLVEVLIATFIVVVAAVGVFGALDATGDASADAQGRQVARGLLTSELQRLRGLSVSGALGSYHRVTTPTAPFGNTTRTYTLTSDVDQVFDANGQTVSCTSDTRAPDYLRATVVVSWPGATAPMTSSTLINPSPGAVGYNQGTLAVHVTDRDGADVRNLAVTVGNRTVSTNALGCAVFGYLAAGATTVKLSQAGWVERDASPSPASEDATVVARQVTNKELVFDQAGTLNVAFKSGGTDLTTTAAQSAVVSNAGGTGFSPLTMPTATAGSKAQATFSLFPFASSYSVYAGDCVAQDPSRYSPANQTAANMVSSVVTRGGVANAVVLMPPVAVTVQNANGSAAPNATVRVKSADGCSDVYEAKTGSSGQVAVPAPYGNFTVCAYSGSNRTNPTTGIKNYAATGVTVPTTKFVSGAATC